MLKIFCTFFFFFEFLCPAPGSVSKDNFNFEEFFVAFELKKIQKELVFDISNSSFQEIRWMDYFILKNSLWNFSTLKEILKIYSEKKAVYYLDIKKWKKVLLQAQNYYPYIQWKKQFFSSMENQQKLFLDYLNESNHDFHDLIQSQLTEEFLASISTYSNNGNSNLDLFGILIPNFLIKEVNEKIVHLSIFEATNFENYKIHYIKYWMRFLFIESFKLINYNHQFV